MMVGVVMRVVGRAPFGATMCKWSKEQVGGASEDAQNYNPLR